MASLTSFLRLTLCVLAIVGSVRRSVLRDLELSILHSYPEPCNYGYIPFSHEIGLDRQQIYARRDNYMRACVIHPKSNHTVMRVR